MTKQESINDEFQELIDKDPGFISQKEIVNFCLANSIQLSEDYRYYNYLRFYETCKENHEGALMYAEKCLAIFTVEKWDFTLDMAQDEYAKCVLELVTNRETENYDDNRLLKVAIDTINSALKIVETESRLITKLKLCVLAHKYEEVKITCKIIIKNKSERYVNDLDYKQFILSKLLEACFHLNIKLLEYPLLVSEIESVKETIAHYVKWSSGEKTYLYLNQNIKGLI